MKYIFGLATFFLFGCGEINTTEGDAFFENGEFEESAKAYTELLKTDPENTLFLYNRGRSYEELGILNKAISDFEKIIKIDPKHINSFLSLSKIAYEQKRYSQALLHAGAAVKQNENSAKAHFLSARAAHQLGYADQALEFYNNAISIDKSDGEAFLYRGALKVGMNRFNSACDDFKRARSLDAEGAASAIKDYCS
ncbi:MAG: tetratricopeptide repeat protein [Cyclobacteriaceae bacterium]